MRLLRASLTWRVAVMFAGTLALATVPALLLAPGSWIVLAGIAAAAVAAMIWGDRVVLAVHETQELTPVGPGYWVHCVTEELCTKAGIRKPALWVAKSPQPNMWSTRGTGTSTIVVTNALMTRFDMRQVRALLARELTRLSSSSSRMHAIGAAFLTLLTYICFLLGLSVLSGGKGDGPPPLATSLALLVFAPLSIWVAITLATRSAHYQADAKAAHLTGDADGLAQALLQLEATARARPGDAAIAAAGIYAVNPVLMRGRLAQLFASQPAAAHRAKRLLSTAATAAPVASEPVVPIRRAA